MLKHTFNSRYTVVKLGDREGEKERDRDRERETVCLCVCVCVCVRKREKEGVCVLMREREQKYELIIATRGYFRTIKSLYFFILCGDLKLKETKMFLQHFGSTIFALLVCCK